MASLNKHQEVATRRQRMRRRWPLLAIGRMVLDRNPDNFFAETQQVAFQTANVAPGIDFSNDPLLQARNFSYSTRNCCC